jgi:hypothetical protein
MKSISLLVLIPLVFAIGCASNPPPPPAAKVQPKKVVPKPPATASNAQPQAKKITPGPDTFAIDNGTSFNAQSIVPSFQTGPLPTSPAAPPLPSLTPTAPQVPGGVTDTSKPAAGVNPPGSVFPGPGLAAPDPVPPALSIVTEDAGIPAGTSPAIVALLTDADRSRNKGDLDGSVLVMERALRLDPRNPTLTYKLAQIRLAQSKPQLAEELAGKAALLAGSNLDLKRKSWLLIADARQKQNNYKGAKEAKAKAESFFGR